jgi:acetyl esterase
MSTTATTTAPVLEPAAQAFADATASPPFLADLPPSEGRALVDEVQSGENSSSHASNATRRLT